jgi:cellobiose-specific phosphotransferase system component IIA
MTDIERCDKEIAQAEAMLRAGHRDMGKLLQQLTDWATWA